LPDHHALDWCARVVRCRVHPRPARVLSVVLGGGGVVGADHGAGTARHRHRRMDARDDEGRARRLRRAVARHPDADTSGCLSGRRSRRVGTVVDLVRRRHGDWRGRGVRSVTQAGGMGARRALRRAGSVVREPGRRVHPHVLILKPFGGRGVSTRVAGPGPGVVCVQGGHSVTVSRIWSFVVGGVALVGATAAYAEVLTADRAVQIALQKSPQVVNAGASVLDARSGVYSSLSGVVPHVSAGWSRTGTWTKKQEGLRFGAPSDTATNAENYQSQTAPGLTASWSVLDLSGLTGLSSARQGLRAAR